MVNPGAGTCGHDINSLFQALAFQVQLLRDTLLSETCEGSAGWVGEGEVSRLGRGRGWSGVGRACGKTVGGGGRGQWVGEWGLVGGRVLRV